MNEYKIVSDFVKKYGGSEEELLRWYYCDALNSGAIERRRLGGEEKLGDKYILFPKILKIEKCLSPRDDSGEPNGGGLEGFFSNDDVIAEGLSVVGFSKFVAKLDRETEKYSKSRGLLDLEWRN